jgi:oligopeptide transport system substrate-binding protein
MFESFRMRFRSGMVALAGLALIAACSPPSRGDGPMTLNRGNGSEIKSLDPHYIDLTSEANVEGDILTGLVTEDAAGEPIPGAALSWETSPDGKTWTFHLRDEVWSDGVPVTSHDFVYAYRRLLEPSRGAPYAYNIWLFKNAQPVNAGKLPGTALGVEAPDDKTLIIHLEHPAPYLLELLMHQTAYPIPRHVVEVKGDAWSRVENFVGNGAYLPKRWIPNDHLTLVKNPRFYDARNVRIQVVNYFPTDDSQAALKRMRAGELDTQTPLPATEIIWLRKHMPHVLQMADYLGTSYITYNIKRKPFDDPRLREALSLAFDREAVNNDVLRFGEKSAYALVPPHTANYPGTAHLRFQFMPMAARIARARQLMAEMGYGPNHHFHTTYEITTDPDNTRVAAALQQMWRKIYADVDIVKADATVHYKNMQVHQFDMAGAAWIADFNDASNFLDLLRSNSGNNYGSYDNPKFDALMDKAQQEPDGKKRGELMNEAEQLALDENAVLPWRFRKTQDLVQPYVRNWIPNARDFNHTRWLWIDPTVKPER